MKPKIITLKMLGVGAIALFFLWVFWYGITPEIANYPPREGGIIAFGDSLVYGMGATDGRDFVSLLSTMIGEEIENFGVSGDTTTRGLERLDVVIAKHPRIVLILLGGNDYLQKIPQNKTFQNLETMIARLEEDGSLVVLLGVRGGLLVDHFDAEFEALSKRKRTVYVPDVLDGLFGNAALMSDGIHPNDAGYRLIAEKIYPELSRVLH